MIWNIHGTWDQINRQTSLKTNTMNEVVILNKFLTSVMPKMHKVRRASLTSCVRSLLNGAKDTSGPD
jgi:hypothetical protein